MKPREERGDGGGGVRLGVAKHAEKSWWRECTERMSRGVGSSLQKVRTETGGPMFTDTQKGAGILESTLLARMVGQQVDHSHDFGVTAPWLRGWDLVGCLGALGCQRSGKGKSSLASPRKKQLVEECTSNSVHCY